MVWMRNFLLFLLVLLMAGTVFARELIYTDGLLLVRFNEDVLPQKLDNGRISVGNPEIDHIFDRYQAQSSEFFFGTAAIFDEEYAYIVRNDYKIWFPKGTDIPQLAAEIEQTGKVAWAVPDIHVPLDMIPNDPHFSTQWFHENIQTIQAWDVATGNETVLVAAIDSGCDWLHEDLYGNLWVNPGEDLDGDPSPSGTLIPTEPGTSGDWDGIDNDGNGVIDDFIGWDFITGVNGMPGEDNTDPDNNPMDFDGHGTGCNSNMAQVANNLLGGAGVAFDCKIVSTRAGYHTPAGEGVVSSSAGVEALNYLRNISTMYEVKMITNMSYGSDSSYPPMVTASASAWNQGVLMFASAGNDGVSSVHYPSAQPNIISVAATTQNDSRANFSNWGTWVDIAAPGVSIKMCDVGGYQTADGTSFSSPIAAGVGALIASRFPNQTNVEWREIIETTVDEISPDHPIGSGRVNAYNALTMSTWPEITIESVEMTDPDGNMHPDIDEVIDVTVEISNREGWQEATLCYANLSFDVEGVEMITSSVLLGNIAPGATANNNDSPLSFRIPTGHPALNGIWANMTVSITAMPNDYEVATSQRLLMGTPDIMFMDDDGAGFQSSYIIDDFEEMGYVYYHHDQSVMTALPTLDYITDYELVCWHTSNTEDPFSAEEIALIEGAMDAGVSFFISGEDIDEQLAGTDFYADYLRAEHSDAAANIAIDAIAGVGGPVIDATRLILTGAGGAGTNSDPDVINPVNGSTAGFTYLNSSTDYGCIFYDGDYKLVYFPFCFESVSDAVANSRIDFLTGLFAWLDLADVEDNSENAEIPTEFAIKSAYPNPFNPSTNIQIAVAHNANVNLKIFDILGREVATLNNGQLTAGIHDFSWNAAMQSSGVYFAVMQADGQTATHKLVLMK